MKRIITHPGKIIPVFAALIALAVGTVWAGPHFLRGSASLDSTEGYCVSFKEAGLGSTPVTYDLVIDTTTFTFQCFTKSNNEPQGAPNGVSFSELTQETTITPHNGQITATICAEPQQDGASCQGGGLKLCLIAVDYEGVTFTDITNGVSLDASATSDLDDSGFSPICTSKTRPK